MGRLDPVISEIPFGAQSPLCLVMDKLVQMCQITAFAKRNKVLRCQPSSVGSLEPSSGGLPSRQADGNGSHMAVTSANSQVSDFGPSTLSTVSPYNSGIYWLLVFA